MSMSDHAPAAPVPIDEYEMTLAAFRSGQIETGEFHRIMERDETFAEYVRSVVGST